jgi:hypothetical protein
MFSLKLWPDGPTAELDATETALTVDSIFCRVLPVYVLFLKSLTLESGFFLKVLLIGIIDGGAL